MDSLTFSSFPPVFLGEGVPMAPVELFNIGGFPVTNSMTSELIVAALLIAFVQIYIRKPALIPTPVQNFAEIIIESLAVLLEGVIGRTMMNRAFWFFASIFIFIVSCNILALVPGVGSIGLGHESEPGVFEIDKPYFRGANTDLNLTAAMAIVFVILWLYWSFTELGVLGVIKHIFGSKAHFPNVAINLLFALVFIFAGVIELLSIAVRPFSLAFRLFGNIYGGEYLMHSASHMVSPWFASLALAPFYIFEVLVAFVQAFVFCILTAAFTGTMCKHEEGHSSTSAEKDHSH